MNEKVFSNFRVLDCTTDKIGSLASAYLAMAGMEVIHVDDPEAKRSRGEKYEFVANNLNKKVVSINYKTPEGLDLLKQLIGKCDVFIENLTFAQIDSMGLTYDALKDKYPQLIVVSIKPFARGSQWQDCPADSAVIHAMGGADYITGLDDREPMVPGPDLAEMSTCAYAAAGAVAALIQRLDTGKGQSVEIASHETIIAHSRSAYEMFHEYGKSARPGNGFAYFREMAPQDLYPTKGTDPNADWVTIGCPADREFELFAKAIGKEYLLEDPKFNKSAARLKNLKELNQIIADWTKQMTKEEIADLLLRKSRVMAAPVRTMAENIKDNDLLKEGVLQKVTGPEGEDMWVPTYPAVYQDYQVKVTAPEQVEVEEVLK